jgi:hypothetical protein
MELTTINQKPGHCAPANFKAMEELFYDGEEYRLEDEFGHCKIFLSVDGKRALLTDLKNNVRNEISITVSCNEGFLNVKSIL